MEDKIEGWKHISEYWTAENIRRHFDKQYLIQEVEDAGNYFEKLKAIRRYYQNNESEILQHGKVRPDQFFFTPYIIDWPSFFTPIENDAWCSFRIRGMVMYPQYPVLNYFVDFGNPNKKIAVEVDGKAFHNKEKDAARDAELLKAGWKVFRIPGSEMWKSEFRTFSDIDTTYGADEKDIEDLIYWITKTGDGVIEGLWRKFFRSDLSDEEIEGFYHNQYFEKSLSDHRLIQ